MVNEKAGDIENWINNLALLNQNVSLRTFEGGLDISMLSDDEQPPTKNVKIEKQILNIKQISNQRKMNSL